ncbi:MAG: metallophosphoesterase family protein [Capnocytophaga sp.]|nr:metallophosphoesterase family protein [Capnocytophaga sp.]
MRTLVAGDIHGAYKALVQVLEKVQIQKEDLLIFLGDYADGWSETPKVIELLIELKKTHNCLFIKGNHDDLCQNFLLGKPMETAWYIHGGGATEKAYSVIDQATKNLHLDFLSSLENYYLDDKNRLFVHAGFTNLRGVEYEYFPEMFFWDRTLWELALSTPKNSAKTDIFFPKRLGIYNEIFIGHTPTTRYNNFMPMHAHGIWNVDTGAAFKGSITILDVDSKKFWQSDPVHTLYPDENGRN